MIYIIMKRILVLPLLALCFSSLSAQPTQEKNYVCTPCGYDCDMVQHSGPGICNVCNMEIVDKTTVHFDNITFGEACKRVTKNGKALLLDVRSPGEFDGSESSRDTFGHLKGAININVMELADRVEELRPYQDTEIIVYCSQSHRSPAATYFLTNNGFKNVVNVSGGVSILEAQFGDDTCVSELFVKH